MLRGPLVEEGYRPWFSGHETFPLRYGWLKKAFDAVAETEHRPGNRSVFTSDSAIGHLGVGKNMVASMRHWAKVAGVVSEDPGKGRIRTTEIGRSIFGEGGLDPYMEHPATLWLIHWQLAGRPNKTTWFWAFNHYSGATFERETLIAGLERLARDRGWARASRSTIRRDVECFVRTYVPSYASKSSAREEALECPLAELGMIRRVGRRDGFRFFSGSKATLGPGIFMYALVEFWRGFSNARSLSFETLAYEPGSPGRVFLLGEDALADRLMALEDVTRGAFRWSETAGLKQVFRDVEVNKERGLGYIDFDYGVPRGGSAS